jgi:hypothetical protein
MEAVVTEAVMAVVMEAPVMEAAVMEAAVVVEAAVMNVPTACRVTRRHKDESYQDGDQGERSSTLHARSTPIPHYLSKPRRPRRLFQRRSEPALIGLAARHRVEAFTAGCSPCEGAIAYAHELAPLATTTKCGWGNVRAGAWGVG